MPDQELRHLLDPITPEAFLEHYWERRPLYIRGSSRKFEGLFCRAAVDRAIAQHESKGIGLRVSYDGVKNTKFVGVHFPIRAAEADSYLARGATVCADPIDRGDAVAAEYAAAIKRQLNHAGTVSVKAYLSSRGCGFNTHFDRQITTTLQIEGRKHWRFSRTPGVPFPTHNGILGGNGEIRYVGRSLASLEPWENLKRVDREDFEEVILEPGDVLCLPAGTWHEAKAIGYSLALNLSFAPLNFLGLLNAVLTTVLRRNPGWRRNLPVYLNTAQNPESPNAEWRRFVSERLDELREVILNLPPEDKQLVRIWRSFVENNKDDRHDLPAFVALRDIARQDQQSDNIPDNAMKHQDLQIAQVGNRSRTAAARYDGTLTYSLCVRELNTAIEWYVKKLGFKLRHRVDPLNWCELETHIPGVTIGLSEFSESRSKGSTTILLGVLNIVNMRERLESMGVLFDGPTQEIPGMVKLATFRDPDGNRLMLSQSL